MTTTRTLDEKNFVLAGTRMVSGCRSVCEYSVLFNTMTLTWIFEEDQLVVRRFGSTGWL